MDFGVVGFDNFSLSVSKNSSFASENGAEQKMYGSGNLNKKERTLINEEEDDLLREFKMAKTTSSSSTMTKMPLQRCSNTLTDGHQQMLSFSSPTVTLPLYHQTSARNPGYGYGGLNSRSMVSEFRGPFTASQWMELEHQALIYKYITANVPIPSHLLNPITKAFHSSYLRPNALGWGGFHLGFSNTDPEPGRCRRTDGKKWRCSRDAVVDQKYCERHLNRGRNRSRKPVEPNSANAKLPPTASSTSVAGGVSNNRNNLSTIPQTNRSPLDKEIPKDNTYSVSKQQSGYEEFGLVCSDSLLNPLNRSSSLVSFGNYGTNSDDETKSQHALRQFMDNWPKNQSAKQNPTISWPEIDVQPDRTQLSISIPTYDNHGASLSHEIEATQMGLGVGSISAWESSMGGPLGEVLHTNGKALNLMENWNNSPSSPTRVLQRGAFGSLSNSSAGSSPRAESNKTLDGVSLYNGATIHPLVSGN